MACQQPLPQLCKLREQHAGTTITGRTVRLLATRAGRKLLLLWTFPPQALLSKVACIVWAARRMPGTPRCQPSAPGHAAARSSWRCASCAWQHPGGLRVRCVRLLWTQALHPLRRSSASRSAKRRSCGLVARCRVALALQQRPPHSHNSLPCKRILGRGLHLRAMQRLRVTEGNVLQTVLELDVLQHLG